MSFGYPAIRPKPDRAQVVRADKNEGTYGVPQLMNTGFQSVKNDISQAHPLEYSESHWNENLEKMDFAMLRNTQGIHAPIRLQMERNTAKKMQRLPFIHSSNLMLDSLTGKLDTIEYDDVLNNPMDSEVMGDPHAMIEKREGLL